MIICEETLTAVVGGKGGKLCWSAKKDQAALNRNSVTPHISTSNQSEEILLLN